MVPGCVADRIGFGFDDPSRQSLNAAPALQVSDQYFAH